MATRFLNLVLHLTAKRKRRTDRRLIPAAAIIIIIIITPGRRREQAHALFTGGQHFACPAFFTVDDDRGGPIVEGPRPAAAMPSLTVHDLRLREGGPGMAHLSATTHPHHPPTYLPPAVLDAVDC